ncbi:iron complex transport system substrate-binding protein [Sphingomonas insulae]|uniref:Fe/B12 periplasmic-binding domain-containing protein n=1 Tax=Sphingomonas insulae TaxID=424800 RepID=A0ABN1HZU6_9SPHN|nr:ABC transporter substrate-binding protein [Sphingomonas insulae]NIJ30699.1 iron complex transport system substrate-binding protein [Sphingomonas insulae]
MRRLIALAALPLLSAAPVRAPRIVSINPCIDAVLMHVADPSQIVGISHYSQDPRATSIPLAQAMQFTATSGTAEEVVALAPDVVMSGPHVAPATIAALKRMRIRLVQYPVPDSVTESEEQVRDIARIAGHAPRGQALARRIASAARPMTETQVPALIWQSGGLVPGAGTLPDELLSRAGFRNMSAVYGLKKWDVLPLEYLIARPPRVLLSVGAAEVGEDRLTAHPAVRRLAQRIAIAPYPSRLMNCGGPTIVAAMARLRRIRKGMGA